MVHSTEVLHIYRRILRAITYLPDSSARIYVHNEVVQRFRRHRPWTSPLHIISNRVRKARAFAGCFERAAHGSSEDLQRVLMHTYGRAGARRRELVKELLRPDESILPKDDTALQQLIENPKAQEPVDGKPSPKVTAFIASQRRNHPKESDRPKIRQLEKPQKTIWDREPVAKLQHSRWLKWWAQVLEKLLPPVPKVEWDRLRDLSLGKIPLDEFPMRRSRPVENTEQQGDMVYRYLQLKLRSEAAQLEGATFDTTRGLQVQTKTREESLGENHEVLLPRARRRLYAHIWRLTPTMSQDETTKVWTVVWGTGKSLIAAGTLTTPSASDMELFEGMENLPEPHQQIVQPHRASGAQVEQYAVKRQQWEEAQLAKNV
ncbi:hypothetical protein L207DRAFT_494721 [Hyaloscypha variabilis F]|uniref:LYR motif-containing protein Cup1-like N-terminal domain-containing protein n=1 Tax=Hyaloscypha variabilis (strain UAMH 11265 / GT02V1 / F) TaxID=1149755 RepID=A0A2J6RBX8_HYAVF|nr:hypothetical protein L207DRAFT_494721 [Hyaloscypha variabilis F]